jgi:hypothetical protein
MLPHSALELGPWESFYVITGSSGAALTGLMFVVVSLASDFRGADSTGISSFATPTVAHFGTVLLIASFLTIPGHTITSLRWSLVVSLVVGLTFLLMGLMGMRRAKYKPVLEDWVFHAALPLVAYIALLIAIGLVSPRSDAALYITACVVILLLFIGIHNAWDAAMWIALERTKRGAPADATETQPEQRTF